MKNKITLKNIVKNLDAIVTCTTLAICVILVNCNVIMRYFFNNPIRWSEEVVTSLFVWTVFIGSAYAYRNHSHLGVDIVVNFMPDRMKKVVSIIMGILELLVLLMLTIISAQYVYHLIFSRTGAFKPALTDMLRIPKWYTGIAVPIGFGLYTYHSIVFLIRDKFGLFKGKKKEGGEEA